MSTTDMRALSRKQWTTERNTLDDINTGSLLRIADAVETMAKGYGELERRAKDAEYSRDWWRAEARRLERKLIAAKGQITKLRKRTGSDHA